MEKENIAQIQRKLGLSEETAKILQEQQEVFNNIQWPEENFKDMSNQIKQATILLYEFFKQNQPEFQEMKLSKLIDILSQEQSKVQFIKKVFKNIKNINFQQKIENPLFEGLYSLFTYLLLKQRVLIQIEQKEKISSKLTYKVWIFFCRSIQRFNQQKIIKKEQISEISATLVVKFIFMNFLNFDLKEALNKIPIYFGFQLEESKYEHTLNQIIILVPEVQNPMAEISLIKNQYIQNLQQYDLNFLELLEQNSKQSKTKSITLTPLVNDNEQKNKKFIYGIQNFKNISFHSNLKKVVGVINFPEKQLRSPLLKEKFQSKVENFIEISQKFNWYKKFTQDINMIILTINQTNYKVAESCSQYLQIKKIRNNFHSVMKISKTMNIPRQKENIILKTFYKLLSRFMEQEFKKSKRERVQSLYEDDVFMKSLFCFCLVLNEFINYSNQDCFQKLVKTCDITYYHFWIILIHFACEFGDQVPLAIKKFIIKLDYKILFDYLWLEKNNGKNEGSYIIGERPRHSIFLIEALIRKLGERIFLITNKIFLSDEIKEQIWILVKSCIFGNSTSNYKTITNIHLDKIILLTIYHISIKSQSPSDLKNLLQIYQNQVLIPKNFSEQELLLFYQDEFRNILENYENQNDNSNNLFLSPGKVSKSKERIHFLICSPLIDNLSPNLKKKDMSFYSSGTLHNLDFDSFQKQSLNQSRKMSEIQQKDETSQEGIKNEIPRDAKFSFANLP